MGITEDIDSNEIATFDHIDVTFAVRAKASGVEIKNTAIIHVNTLEVNSNEVTVTVKKDDFQLLHTGGASEGLPEPQDIIVSKRAVHRAALLLDTSYVR